MLAVHLCQIVLGDVQIGLFGHGHTAMTQYFAQRVDISATHQEALSKVVSEHMRVDVLQADSMGIFPHICFKVTDLYALALVGTEEKIAVTIPVFVLHPALKQGSHLIRVEYISPLFALGILSGR